MSGLALEFVVPQTGLGIFLGAVASKGRSFVTDGRRIVARDEDSGDVVWLAEGRGDPVAVVGSKLLCSGPNVSLLRVADGGLVGVFEGAEHRCVLVGEILIDARADGVRDVLSARTTSRVLWEVAIGSDTPRDATFARRVRTGPVTDGRRVFVGLNDDTLMAIDPLSGTVVWQRPTKVTATLRATPEGLLMLIDGFCRAFSPDSGEHLWEAGGGFGAFFDGDEGTVLWNGGAAVEVHWGQPKGSVWLKKPNEVGALAEPLVVLPGFYLAGSGTGHVMAFSRLTGKCVALFRPKGGRSTKIGDISMAIGKGRIYYRDWSKRLYCLRAPFLDSPGIGEPRPVAKTTMARKAVRGRGVKKKRRVT